MRIKETTKNNKAYYKITEMYLKILLSKLNKESCVL